MEQIMGGLRSLPPFLIENTPKLILALLIFWIGRKIVRRLSGAAVSTTSRMPTIDETLARFFGSMVLFVGMAAVLVSALTAMNINLAFIGTIIAAMMVALGFALQDSLGDVASGIMLALFRPYAVGDEVELNGEKGVVTRLGLFATYMKTRDNIELVVGNGAAFGGTIRNFNAFGTRRLDMDFGVGYDADLDVASAAIIKAAASDARVAAHPPPWVKVTGLGDSAVTLQLRVWCAADDHRGIKMDISQLVKEALDAANIEIPYEHGVIVRKAS